MIWKEWEGGKILYELKSLRLRVSSINFFISSLLEIRLYDACIAGRKSQFYAGNFNAFMNFVAISPLPNFSYQTSFMSM